MLQFGLRGNSLLARLAFSHVTRRSCSRFTGTIQTAGPHSLKRGFDSLHLLH